MGTVTNYIQGAREQLKSLTENKAEQRQAATIAKRQRTVQELTRLLEAQPAAEELKETWAQPHRDEQAGSSSKVPRKDKINGPLTQSQSMEKPEPRLSDLRKAFDGGAQLATNREGTRGVPMWLVVRMCKASWHHEGLWPLLGCDEEIPARPTRTQLDAAVAAGLHVSRTEPIRSVHPSHLLLRPPNVTSYEAPPDPDQANKATTQKQEERGRPR